MNYKDFRVLNIMLEATTSKQVARSLPSNNNNTSSFTIAIISANPASLTSYKSLVYNSNLTRLY